MIVRGGPWMLNRDSKTSFEGDESFLKVSGGGLADIAAELRS